MPMFQTATVSKASGSVALILHPALFGSRNHHLHGSPFALPALWFTMQAIVVLGTAHPGAMAPPLSRSPISENMSNAAQSGIEPTFYFHVLQYVFFNNLIYKGLWLQR